MKEIDGSYGEGGGQIVRTAVALAAVTGTPIKITKIRQGRPRPGLAAQHTIAILALSRICNARTMGIEPGSSEITFSPGHIEGGEYRVDIGTAGSIALLIQCLLPAMINAETPTTLTINGGTDVRWSPTIDYLRNVYLPAIAKFGVQASIDCQHRGYYPKGGGMVELMVVPGMLRSANLESESPIEGNDAVRGISHCSNLPDHVARRQAESAASALENAGFGSKVELQVQNELSTGSGITLWAGHKGGSALGERGIRAEDVGRAAADGLIAELKSQASVDLHLADQLIPFLALAGGVYSARQISKHTSTNIWTAGQFLDTEIFITDTGIGKVRKIEGRL
jgi:RNA 3'-terminal phosphate cyclase (ATP)